MNKKDELMRVNFLLKHINLVENDVKDKTLEQFGKSDLQVRATSFSLMQIGEQMNKLEQHFRDSYPDIPWADARSMRNIIVHVYAKVDVEQVYKTATTDIQELKQAFLKIKQDLTKSL